MLGPLLRGNTPKHASKHTKHARKHTIHHIANIAKIRQNMICIVEWDVGVHTCPWWVFMGSDECVGVRGHSVAREWEFGGHRWPLCTGFTHTVHTQYTSQHHTSQGYRWPRCWRMGKQGIIKCLKDPIKTDGGSKGKRRESAKQNEHSKRTKTDLRTCIQ